MAVYCQNYEQAYHMFRYIFFNCKAYARDVNRASYINEKVKNGVRNHLCVQQCRKKTDFEMQL